MDVFSKLSGGLGNQLFQYAIGRRLALLHDRPLVVDVHWYHSIPPGSTPRRELLGAYPIIARRADSGGVPESLVGARRARWPFARGPVCTRREKQPFRFDPRLLTMPRGQALYLEGYWQSFRYIDPIREHLLAELQPMRPASAHYAGVARQIDNSESVMLHVRRGDYVHSASAAAAHGALPLAYYERALRHVAAAVHAPVVFVFSDDLDWARANLRVEAPVVFVDSAPGDEAVVDELRLMSRCRHQIIANSSLSWWAAWLNTHPGRIVTAPDPWFAGQPVPLDDLIPPQWQRLAAR